MERGNGQQSASSGIFNGETCPLALIFVRTILGQHNPEKYGPERALDGTFIILLADYKLP
jgi:hypothetical protein